MSVAIQKSGSIRNRVHRGEKQSWSVAIQKSGSIRNVVATKTRKARSVAIQKSGSIRNSSTWLCAPKPECSYSEIRVNPQPDNI